MLNFRVFPITCSSIFVLEQDVSTLHARGNRTADIACNNAGSNDGLRLGGKELVNSEGL